MDRYSLIVVADETAPVRRFNVRKAVVRRAVWGAGVAAVILTLCFVDYVRVRIAHGQLAELRTQVAEQQGEIDSFETTIRRVRAKLDRVGEFERKVRIIANLPGAAASGGEEIAEVEYAETENSDAPREVIAIAPLPATEEAPSQAAPAAPAAPASRATPSRDPVAAERQIEVEQLDEAAAARATSLTRLVAQLEDKRHRLASTPAIWPTKGWMTSRFGLRVSPFTNQSQFHAGIDIAGQRGADVVAPARGEVVFSGKRGPLGNSIIIDHGFGVRTLYGHGDDLYVKRGEKVDRGMRIASLGNSGRSTGPHLHYVVEVDGKAVNPLNYIFD